MSEAQRSKRYIRPATAAEKLGISLPSLWRLIKSDPDFPKGIKLSARVTVLDEDAIDASLERKRGRSVSGPALAALEES